VRAYSIRANAALASIRSVVPVALLLAAAAK
jgi:hypothetical protein